LFGGRILAINIPKYQSVYSNSPVENAYAWMSHIVVDFRRKSGTFRMDIHPHIDDWEKNPIGQISVSLGDSSDEENIKTLDQLLQIPEFKQSFEVIAFILYQESLKHPILKDANITEA
jgi:hypothetical protein